MCGVSSEFGKFTVKQYVWPTKMKVGVAMAMSRSGAKCVVEPLFVF